MVSGGLARHHSGQVTEDQRTSADGATLRDLIARVKAGAVRNKGLVVAMIVAAVLQSLFTKGTFLLVKPLFDAIAPDDNDVGGSRLPGEELLLDAKQGIGQWLTETFTAFAVWLRDLLGIDFGAESEKKAVVFACAIVAVFAGVLGSFAIYSATVLSRYFASKVIVDLRNELADHILRLPLRYFGRRRMGELISRLTNDTAILSRTFTLVTENLVTDPMMLLGNVILVGAAVPWALVFYLPAIPLMALPMIRLGRKVHKRTRGSLEAMGDSTESLSQMLSGIKVVKAFQLEDERLREFEHNNAEYLARTRRMLEAKGRSQAWVFLGYQASFAGLIVLLGWLLVADHLEVSDVVLVLLPVSTTYQHVKRLARSYNTAMESVGALDEIQVILSEQHDVAGAPGRTVLDPVVGRIELQGVDFAYGDEPVLRDVSLVAEPGETIALVGPSGAGKSTCVDLIARFHDPTGGRILVDGHDLRDVDLSSYRRRVAMVTQQPFLFNASVYDNIVCGRVGATRDEVVEAARRAQIHEFVETLPLGYDTVVGERGSNLSGGQMQRITIARAIVRDPVVLFLDEATSALDSESEEAVQRALNELMRGRTSFVIAHRLSTIRDASQILVFEAGQIVERGDHASLSAQDGLYKRLIDLQELR